MRVVALAFTMILAVFQLHGVTWSPEELIANAGNPGGNGPQQTIAINASGQAVTVWIAVVGADNRVMAATRTGSGLWDVYPTPLSAAGQDASFPAVSIDSSGNAAAAWVRSDGADNRVEAATYSAGVWTPAASPLSPAGNEGQSPQVAAYDNGEVVAVWLFNSVPANIQTRSFIAGAWTPALGGAPDVLDSGSNNLQAPQISMNDSGYGVAIWYSNTGGNFRIHATTFVGGVWSGDPFDELTGAVGDARRPQIAVAANGNAVAVWDVQTASFATQSASLPFGGAWSAPINVTGVASTGAPQPKVGIDASGNAIAAWGQALPAVQTEVATLASGAGAWSAATNVSGAGAGTIPQLAVNSSGSAIVTWNQNVPPISVFSATGTYSENIWTKQTVDTPASGIDLGPVVAIDGFGNGVIVWNNNNGGVSTIYSSFGMSPLQPPSVPGGIQTLHRFATQGDLINYLVWEEAAGSVVAYRIYRDNPTNFIAETDGTTYEDHQREPGQTTTYYITSVDASGNESSVATFSVAPL